MSLCLQTDRGFYDLNFNPRWSDRKPYASLEPDVTIQQKSAPPKEQPVKGWLTIAFSLMVIPKLTILKGGFKPVELCHSLLV